MEALVYTCKFLASTSATLLAVRYCSVQYWVGTFLGR